MAGVFQPRRSSYKAGRIAIEDLAGERQDPRWGKVGYERSLKDARAQAERRTASSVGTDGASVVPGAAGGITNMQGGSGGGDLPPRPVSSGAPDPDDERKAYQRARDEIVRLWTSKRGTEKEAVIAFKLAVEAEFGIGGDIWNPKGHTPASDRVEALKSVVRRMYEETQQALAERGIDHAHLYRAFRSKTIPPVYTPSVVEGWTSAKASTSEFKPTVILEEDVPAGRILMWHEGPGWTQGEFGQQYEYLVLSEEPTR